MLVIDEITCLQFRPNSIMMLATLSQIESRRSEGIYVDGSQSKRAAIAHGSSQNERSSAKLYAMVDRVFGHMHQSGRSVKPNWTVMSQSRCPFSFQTFRTLDQFWCT